MKVQQLQSSALDQAGLFTPRLDALHVEGRGLLEIAQLRYEACGMWRTTRPLPRSSRFERFEQVATNRFSVF